MYGHQKTPLAARPPRAPACAWSGDGQQAWRVPHGSHDTPRPSVQKTKEGEKERNRRAPKGYVSTRLRQSVLREVVSGYCSESPFVWGTVPG